MNPGTTTLLLNHILLDPLQYTSSPDHFLSPIPTCMSPVTHYERCFSVPPLTTSKATMSYAAAAAKGPKQTVEEVCLQRQL